MRTRHFYLLCVTAAVVLTVFSGCGQKSTPLQQKKHAKPWADVDSTAQIEADPQAIHEADSLAKVDSIARVDSLARADSIARAEAAKASYQTLKGTIGSAEALVRFSTINGRMVMGNAVVGWEKMEISGQYADAERSALTLDEMSRDHSHPTLHMEMQATDDGFQGTYTKGSEQGAVSLKRE